MWDFIFTNNNHHYTLVEKCIFIAHNVECNKIQLFEIIKMIINLTLFMELVEE